MHPQSLSAVKAFARMNLSLWMLAAGLLSASTAALAQPQNAAPEVAAKSPAKLNVTAQSVAQKQSMLDRMLFQSSVSSRVLASGDEVAKKHLSNARTLFQHGQQLAATQMFKSADTLFNDALSEYGKAQHLVPDPAAVRAEGRHRYQQLDDTYQALKRTTAIAMPARPDDAGRSTALADELAQQATALANANRYAEANAKLDQALVILMKDAASRLSGQTLVYSQQFASKREEYEYELGRYMNYERLVPLAIQEFKPSSEALTLVRRHLEQGKVLRGNAVSQSKVQPEQAIRTINEATEQIKRALAAAGLQVPQTMEANP